jgi:hypothetical protein
MNPKLLPTVMIVLSVLSGIVYAANKDFRHSVYWFAAAVLTTAVTF